MSLLHAANMFAHLNQHAPQLIPRQSSTDVKDAIDFAAGFMKFSLDIYELSKELPTCAVMDIHQTPECKTFIDKSTEASNQCGLDGPFIVTDYQDLEQLSKLALSTAEMLGCTCKQISDGQGDAMIEIGRTCWEATCSDPKDIEDIAAVYKKLSKFAGEKCVPLAKEYVDFINKGFVGKFEDVVVTVPPATKTVDLESILGTDVQETGASNAGGDDEPDSDEGSSSGGNADKDSGSDSKDKGPGAESGAAKVGLKGVLVAAIAFVGFVAAF